MKTLVRRCIRCDKSFYQVHRRGRPRQLCFECRPAGTEIVTLRSGHVKLRRRNRYSDVAKPAA